MPLRAIDFHVHLPTPDWLDGSKAGYVEAAGAYFRSPVRRQSLAELAARYRGLGLMAVLLAWDAETATGRPRVPNQTVAAACQDHPSVFSGLGSVDPHKGPAAVAEVANIARLGLRGRRSDRSPLAGELRHVAKRQDRTNPNRWEACEMTSISYEIRVAGTIAPEALIDFEQLTAGPRAPSPRPGRV